IVDVHSADDIADWKVGASSDQLCSNSPESMSPSHSTAASVMAASSPCGAWAIAGAAVAPKNIRNAVTVSRSFDISHPLEDRRKVGGGRPAGAGRLGTPAG